MFSRNKKSSVRPNGPAQLMNNRFALNLPEGWKDQSIYRFSGPEEDGIEHNIIVTIEHNVPHTDLNQFAEIHIHAVEQTLQGYHELKRGAWTTDGWQPAYEIVYKWTPVQDRRIYQRVLYLLEGSTGYILTASFSKKTWKTKGPELDRIFKSFRGAQTASDNNM